MQRSYSLASPHALTLQSEPVRFATYASFVHSGIPGPIVQAGFDGTAGDDDYDGTASDDIFDMGLGGNDKVSARGGDDVVFMGNSLTAADRIDGGNDSGGIAENRDWMFLAGDYSAGLTFSANTVTRVENIFLTPGNSYKLTLHDNTCAAADIMAIRGNTLGPGDDMTIDISADTNSTILLYGGQGTDRFTGGSGNSQSSFYAGTLAVSDRVDGGTGGDAIQLLGDYSAGFTFGSKTIRNIDNLYVTAGDDFSLTMNDGNLASGDTMVIYGSYLGVGNHLTFDASAERDAHYYIIGGPDHDELIAGRAIDYINGGFGGDFITPGKGADRVIYEDAGESSGARYDFIIGFDFADADRFVMDFVPSAIDTKINTGTLSPLSFEADLVAAVDAAHLAAGHAVLFTPDAGTLAGERFLIVDANGAAGYQSGGADWVVRLTDPVHLGALDTADFQTTI